jgi:hypothetical protein
MSAHRLNPKHSVKWLMDGGNSYLQPWFDALRKAGPINPMALALSAKSMASIWRTTTARCATLARRRACSISLMKNATFVRMPAASLRDGQRRWGCPQS